MEAPMKPCVASTGDVGEGGGLTSSPMAGVSFLLSPCAGSAMPPRLPDAHQITECFVCRIRNGNQGQLAGAIQFGQFRRVTAVRLDSFAASSWCQRRRRDLTINPLLPQMPRPRTPAVILRLQSRGESLLRRRITGSRGEGPCASVIPIVRTAVIPFLKISP